MSLAIPAGANVKALIPQLVRHLDAQAAKFAVLHFAPLFEERAEISREDVIIANRARRLRQDLGIPFWDAAMLEASRSKENNLGTLRATAYHQSITDRAITVPVNDLSEATLDSMVAKIAHDKNLLVFLSRVETREGERHIPLLDLHIRSSENGLRLVKEFIKIIGIPGFILNSGKSYHFYGMCLLDKDSLREFLGKALLFSPIVDRSWIAHQLIEGFCALRISPRTEYGEAPTLAHTQIS